MNNKVAVGRNRWPWTGNIKAEIREWKNTWVLSLSLFLFIFRSPPLPALHYYFKFPIAPCMDQAKWSWTASTGDINFQPMLLLPRRGSDWFPPLLFWRGRKKCGTGNGERGFVNLFPDKGCFDSVFDCIDLNFIPFERIEKLLKNINIHFKIHCVLKQLSSKLSSLSPKKNQSIFPRLINLKSANLKQR